MTHPMRSLRTKITLLFVLVATVGTVVTGMLSYLAMTDRLNTEVNASLASVAAEAQRDSHDGDRNRPGGGPTGLNPIDLLRTEQMVTQTLDPAGNVTSPGTGLVLPVTALDRQVASGQLGSARRDEVIDDTPFRVLTVALSDGGALQVARSTVENERVLDQLRSQILVVVLVVVLLSGLAGWVIARQLTRRLARLTDAAEQVASTGRLDVPVPTEGTDEAGRLGVALASMLEALRRSRDSQQRLVQDAGHELRTPLTSLRTNVSVLRRHADLPDEQRGQVLSDLDAETRELTDLVNELVALASDQADEEPEQRVTLAPLVERVAERTRRRFGCEVAVDADGTEVLGRPAALERAVSNLLDNAAKFGGGAPVRVTVVRGTVTVTDQGPGIAAADAPHVFDRFFRADTARSMPGSGLGLAIVRDVAESHGGTAFARTTPNGTQVGIRLPVAPAQP
jgi:two-component system sensor histidine kinase MprB